jgi:very-short-patch-repair endonuclease
MLVFRDSGGWLAKPDLSLREAKLALEYQGAEHAKVKRMRRDITRETDMRREGWRVLDYGPAEVFGRPWEIAPEVRQLVQERAPHLLRRRPSRQRVVT